MQTIRPQFWAKQKTAVYSPAPPFIVIIVFPVKSVSRPSVCPPFCVHNLQIILLVLNKNNNFIEKQTSDGGVVYALKA